MNEYDDNFDDADYFEEVADIDFDVDESPRREHRPGLDDTRRVILAYFGEDTHE